MLYITLMHIGVRICISKLWRSCHAKYPTLAFGTFKKLHVLRKLSKTSQKLQRTLFASLARLKILYLFGACNILLPLTKFLRVPMYMYRQVLLTHPRTHANPRNTVMLTRWIASRQMTTRRCCLAVDRRAPPVSPTTSTGCATSATSCSRSSATSASRPSCAPRASAWIWFASVSSSRGTCVCVFVLLLLLCFTIVFLMLYQ